MRRDNHIRRIQGSLILRGEFSPRPMHPESAPRRRGPQPAANALGEHRPQEQRRGRTRLSSQQADGSPSQRAHENRRNPGPFSAAPAEGADPAPGVCAAGGSASPPGSPLAYGLANLHPRQSQVVRHPPASKPAPRRNLGRSPQQAPLLRSPRAFPGGLRRQAGPFGVHARVPI